MATVTVRYIVDDVDAAIDFYCGHLGFREEMHPAPTFAMLGRGDLRLALSAPGGPAGGGQAMPDGTLPTPGGWNRISLESTDLAGTVERLRRAGLRFRNELVTGVGGNQILLEDPSGNPVELFEPTRPEARAEWAEGRYDVRPIGRVESRLVEVADAPNQAEGAPDAWLVIHDDVREGIRDLAVGSEVIVLTWFDRSRRDELATVPGDDPGGPERGVFSTRSPHRPNPVGLHRAAILELDGGRIHVDRLEAVDGTPVIDIKPVLHRTER